MSWDSPGGKDDIGGSSSGAARGAAGGAATQRAIANRGSNKKPKQASESGPKKKARDATEEVRVLQLASPSGKDKKSFSQIDPDEGSKCKGIAGRGGGAVPSEGECIVCWERPV